MVELARFAYFATPWNAIQSQILAFAAQRLVAVAYTEADVVSEREYRPVMDPASPG